MQLSYVLITPAHNEDAHLEKTIQSVIAQTILPKKWVIVNDGSTDQTDRIIRNYLDDNRWIEYVALPERKERHFAAKAHAFNAGYQRVKELDYDIIGNIDADISFGEDFFEYLLDKFSCNAELGVAGTDYIEGTFHSYRDSYINVHHVNGQCQLFRRKCFEEIGGYTPIKDGGIDWVAVTTARMMGWETYSFSDRTYTHHHIMGRTHGNIFAARFHYGKKDYFCGGHPLWQILRGHFQMTKKPYVIGGSLMILGFFWSWVTRTEIPISKELMHFHRQEQMKRLKFILKEKLMLKQ